MASLIDKTKPIKLVYLDNALTTFPPQSISVNSDKYIKFTHWLSENNCGWTFDPVTYVSMGVYISQSDFTLQYFSIGGDFVVIDFADKKGGHQFSKRVGKGELDFLFK